MNDTIKTMKDPLNSNMENKSVSLFGQDEIIDRKKGSVLKSTNEDVQRAIEGLKDIPDEELQEFLDDEDFMKGLDVVDAWEGEEERNRDMEHKIARIKEREQKHSPRDRHRRDHKGCYTRERPKREEKKREEIRRDPSKSTKDIERDKMRTKRDNESKLLAEKEKAIKNLLDSDNVVPPGTEVEAIQSITEKQNLERAQMHIYRNKDRRRSFERQRGSSLRRRSPDRAKLNSPRRRTPLILSPERRRSPFKTTLERHRSPLGSTFDKRRSPLRFNYDQRSPHILTPERRRTPLRRISWERRSSVDKRWSIERHRRRLDVYERRRSRSRDRQRSRSIDRFRRRCSRSPISRRYSPRRRNHTRSKSSERRIRKRSPFINELARQLRNEAMMPHMNSGFVAGPLMDGISPLMNTIAYQQESESRSSLPATTYAHQQTLAPPLPPTLSATGGASFVNFELPSPSISFDHIPVHTLPQSEYTSAPVMYSQTNASSIQTAHRPALLSATVLSPQPVPAPTSMHHVQIMYTSSHGIPTTQKSPTQGFESHDKSVLYNEYSVAQEERLKTPEPPVISNTKRFEKTSLSSLLEASVSAKGFKPEILHHCEHALRELPIEDPRLKMRGRFFYDPLKEDMQAQPKIHTSNSVLLYNSKSKICWEEEEEHHVTLVKQCIQTHQKICQTNEVKSDTKSVQASIDTVDSEAQVYPHDLQQLAKDEKRPIMDRLDWNVRETFDYAPKFREVDDLRWSLNNSSQKRVWSKTTSPSKQPNDHQHQMDAVSSLDHNSRSLKLRSPMRTRDSFSSQKGSMRDHYVQETYSPNYRHSLDDRDDFHESRSEHSCGESPMVLDDSGEELEVERTFQRSSDWPGRGKSLRGRSSPLTKPHVFRGKHLGGRPYRGRGSFRGKY